MDIKKWVEDNFEQVVAHRRHLHENPELSGQEDSTCAYIVAELERLGIPCVNVPEGGVLGFIDGERHGLGKRVLLRADIDALPIQESENNLKGPRTVRSKTDGVMHACGHDAHTAMLLGAAKILSENRDQIEGKVLLCFERGEEGTGNIRYLLEYMEREDLMYDSAFGLHVGALPTGMIAIRDGGLMAAPVPINITIRGKGGHGSRPDQSDNPIDCLTSLLVEIGKIRMKHISPFEPVTLSICSIHAGTVGNVIPDEVSIKGTCRCFSVADAIVPFQENLEKICLHCGAMNNCEVTVEWGKRGPLPVYNNPQLGAVARQAIADALGERALAPIGQIMGSESFSLIGQFAPSVFGFVGIHTPEQGTGANAHNQYFDLDEAGMKTGVAAHVAYALAYLRHEGEVAFTPAVSSVAELYKNG